MSESGKKLHIITFDIPYPPNYGGVIDVYYKIKFLYEQGVKIWLHCFQYGRQKSIELENNCEKIFYYPRIRVANPFSVRMPYIVKTRKSRQLMHHLLENDWPVLFEGLHTTYYLNHTALKDRLKIVRMHNIEYVYYKHLAKVEKNPLKRFYYANEARCLRTYQQILDKADLIAAISPSDYKILRLKHGSAFYLPVFHPNEKITSLPGTGEYVLYHGNLGVGENNEAALFLVESVFSEIMVPVVIAGMNPSPRLKKAVKKHYHIKLMQPRPGEMDDLISQAHINILPTFQATGIKLKLLNALFKGRHCLVNSTMVKDTGLEDLCVVADKPEDFALRIKELMKKPFEEKDREKRRQLLLENFDNRKNAGLLVERLLGS